MAKLAAFLLLTAQGVPFIQTGQTFLRTKFGDHNSYDKPDAVNMIRWREKAENHDIFLYDRELIALRKGHPLFTLATADEVRRAIRFLDEYPGYTIPPGCLGWQIEDVTGQDSWRRALVLVNTNPRPIPVPIPPGEWQLYVNGRQASRVPISSRPVASFRETSLDLDPRSAMLLAESREWPELPELVWMS